MPFYRWEELPQEKPGPSYSSAVGGILRGKDIMFAKLKYPAGSEAKPHSHENEQFWYLTKGKVICKIGDEEERTMGPGDIAHIPADVVHYTKVLDEEVEAITCKHIVEGRLA